MRRDQQKKPRRLVREIRRKIKSGWSSGNQEKKGFQKGKNYQLGQIILIEQEVRAETLLLYLATERSLVILTRMEEGKRPI